MHIAASSGAPPPQPLSRDAYILIPARILKRNTPKTRALNRWPMQRTRDRQSIFEVRRRCAVVISRGIGGLGKSRARPGPITTRSESEISRRIKTSRKSSPPRSKFLRKPQRRRPHGKEQNRDISVPADRTPRADSARDRRSARSFNPRAF